MFIKKIEKKNAGAKIYTSFRLCESFRIGDKTRHNNLLNLGTLDGLHPDERKMLANRIEELYHGNTSNLFHTYSAKIEQLATKFHQELREKSKILADSLSTNECHIIGIQAVEKDFENVDINSIKHDEVREIGAEWLCLQAIDELGLVNVLQSTGMETVAINKALALLVSRAVYPASEHKTSQWIQSSSAITELIFGQQTKLSHHQLYDAGDILFERKEIIEQHLCSKTNELFDLKDKIVFYDLTNTYFEGRKSNSQLAQFGRSKEKRSDAKLVSLALVVNAEGFVKYSKIYEGNIYEAHTLLATVEALAANTSFASKPVVVMDAGIATEENLLMLKEKQYDYLCVSRVKLKDYKVTKTDSQPIEISDNRGNKIALQCVTKENCSDQFMHIRSQQKAVKEASMNAHYSTRFEEELNNLARSIKSKGGVKGIEKVYERLGRIKERYAAANKYYNITIKENDKIAQQLTFTKIALAQASQTEGVYFIRTSIAEQDEKIIWDIYNTLTEIEASFRTLKTDLNIRPVFHQKDERTQAHIQLGVLAYMVVNSIRHKLKLKGIRHDWRNIVRIMNTQKVVKTSFINDQGKAMMIKKCSEPNIDVLTIYNACNYKTKPFGMKKFVLPQ